MFDYNKFQNNNGQSINNTLTDFVPLTETYIKYIEENRVKDPIPEFITATIYAISSKNMIANSKGN